MQMRLTEAPRRDGIRSGVILTPHAVFGVSHRVLSDDVHLRCAQLQCSPESLCELFYGGRTALLCDSGLRAGHVLVEDALWHRLATRVRLE